MLALQYLEQLDLAIRIGGVGWDHIGRRPFERRLFNGALALGVVILEEMVRVAREIGDGRKQCAFFVVVVIALRPFHHRKRRILAVPGARVILRPEDALLRIGATVAKSFIEAADAVMQAGQKHQVAGTPGIEIAVSKHSGHSEALHLGNIVPTQFCPLVGQSRIDPCVVGSIAYRVVVEKRNRLVQIVQHLRMPAKISVENVARQFEGHGHGVAVVIVRDIVSPIKKVRPNFVGIGFVPFVDIDHAVAAVHFDHGSDEHDHVRADVLDIRRIIDGQTIGEFHQGRGRSSLG